jgi:GGDEF domain-containing protein
VNDRQGHGAGDALLRNFAGVLTNTFRESDVIARVGGDEFCVFGAELDLNLDVLVARLEYNIARSTLGRSRSPPAPVFGAVRSRANRRWKNSSPTPMKRCMRASAPAAKSDNSVNSGFLR